MAVAFVFPGQGSQAVGMGKALADSFRAGPRACSTRSMRRSARSSARSCGKGRPTTLTLTENAQPALMAVSLAAMRVLEAEAGLDLARDAQFVAGHSLGEYSALAAAGRLQHRRCRAAAAHARARHAEGGAGRRRRDGGAARPRLRRSGRGRRARPRKARSARPPTTMAAGRSWSPATRPRSSARSRSPRPRAPSARCCCRCPRRSIAR